MSASVITDPYQDTQRRIAGCVAKIFLTDNLLHHTLKQGSQYMENLFQWRHFQGEIVLTCTRWYLRYALSYRDLEEMMIERGLSVDHTTIYRWVQRYAPELDKRSQPYLKQTNDSWRVDETYVKVRGRWMYLYRAVDSSGQTLDFLLNQTRSTRVAKRFFRKVLGRSHIAAPRVINVDKNGCYIGAVRDLKKAGLLPEKCKRRPSRYMNNMVEQDHRFMKRRIKPGLGFSSYPTAWRTIRAYEVMHMIRKGQIMGADKGNIKAQNQFIAEFVWFRRVSQRLNFDLPACMDFAGIICNTTVCFTPT